MNQNAEEIARDKIDKQLTSCGWTVQKKSEINLSAGIGVAVREYITDVGPADYILFVEAWITVGEITKDEGMYLRTVSSYINEAGKERSRFVPAGSLLLINSGATLGVPKITEIDGCIHDGNLALLSIDGTLKYYLFHFLKSQTKKLRQINQGAAQPNLNTTIVNQMIVPFPS